MNLTWSLGIAAAAAAQWIVFLAIAAFSGKRMRSANVRLVLSSVVFLVAWGIAFDARSLVASHSSRVNEASAAGMTKKSTGSCASIEVGMSTQQVKSVMGEPHEVKTDEETRGPGAAIWVYKDLRCAVHVLDDKVEFVD